MRKPSKTFGRTSRPGRPKPGSVTLLLLPIFAMVLSGCASRSPVVVTPDCPTLTPPPAELMEEIEPNLRQRLQQLSGESPLTETPRPDG